MASARLSERGQRASARGLRRRQYPPSLLHARTTGTCSLTQPATPPGKRIRWAAPVAPLETWKLERESRQSFSCISRGKNLYPRCKLERETGGEGKQTGASFFGFWTLLHKPAHGSLAGVRHELLNGFSHGWQRLPPVAAAHARARAREARRGREGTPLFLASNQGMLPPGAPTSYSLLMTVEGESLGGIQPERKERSLAVHAACQRGNVYGAIAAGQAPRRLSLVVVVSHFPNAPA